MICSSHFWVLTQFISLRVNSELQSMVSLRELVGPANQVHWTTRSIWTYVPSAHPKTVFHPLWGVVCAYKLFSYKFKVDRFFCWVDRVIDHLLRGFVLQSTRAKRRESTNFSRGCHQVLALSSPPPFRGYDPIEIERVGSPHETKWSRARS